MEGSLGAARVHTMHVAVTIAVLVFSGAVVASGHGALMLSGLMLGAVLVASLRVARQCLADARRQNTGTAGLRLCLMPAILTAASVLSLALSTMIPPLQSPDEFSHLQRAYSLLDGQFLIRENSRDSPLNQQVDSGLRSYIDAWQHQLATKRDNKVTASLEGAMRKTGFSGKEVELFDGSAAYFPVLYAPAAGGLGLARALDQPVWVGATWARNAMWLCAIVAAGLALVIARVGVYTMAAVLLLPMTLAQIGSSNLDAITISFGLLAVSLMTAGLYGGGRDSVNWSRGVRLAAWMLLGMLVVTKPVFVALLGPPLVWAILRRPDRKNLVAIVVVVLALCTWTFHLASNFVDVRVVKPVSTFTALFHALGSPVETLGLIWQTIVVKGGFYWQTMIGVLGWLDTPLTPRIYAAAGTLLGAALIADSLTPNRFLLTDRVAFALSVVGYAVLFMLIMYAAWVPATGGVIEGVQGRYFLPVLPLVGALCGRRANTTGAAAAWIFGVATIAYGFVLVSELPRVLLYRYWM